MYLSCTWRRRTRQAGCLRSQGHRFVWQTAPRVSRQADFLGPGIGALWSLRNSPWHDTTRHDTTRHTTWPKERWSSVPVGGSDSVLQRNKKICVRHVDYPHPFPAVEKQPMRLICVAPLHEYVVNRTEECLPRATTLLPCHSKRLTAWWWWMSLLAHSHAHAHTHSLSSLFFVNTSLSFYVCVCVCGDHLLKKSENSLSKNAPGWVSRPERTEYYEKSTCEQSQVDSGKVNMCTDLSSVT